MSHIVKIQWALNGAVAGRSAPSLIHCPSLSLTHTYYLSLSLSPSDTLLHSHTHRNTASLFHTYTHTHCLSVSCSFSLSRLLPFHSHQSLPFCFSLPFLPFSSVPSINHLALCMSSSIIYYHRTNGKHIRYYGNLTIAKLLSNRSD